MKLTRQSRSLFSILRIVNGFVLIAMLNSCNTDKNSYTSYNSLDNQDANFVGSVSCKTCHQEEFNDWQNSHHDQAMKIADSTTILADFNNTTFIPYILYIHLAVSLIARSIMTFYTSILQHKISNIIIPV